MTVNVQNGVEVGTEIHFRHAEKENKPVIFAINGLDHEKANFEKSMEMMRDRLSHGYCAHSVSRLMKESDSIQ